MSRVEELQVSRIAEEAARGARARAVESILGFNGSKAFSGDSKPTASIFLSLLDGLDHESPEKLISFNLEVTQLAVRIVEDEASDAVTFAATASRIVELGGYRLINPRAPHDHCLVLGPAKRHGYFFTPWEIADRIAELAIGKRDHLRRILDPCAGAGVLIAAAMVRAKQSGREIEGLVAVERDSFTSKLSKTILGKVKELTGFSGSLDVICADGVGFLEEMSMGRYDAIVMNPPYGKIKFDSDFLTNGETRVNEDHTKLIEAMLREETRREASRLRVTLDRLGIGGRRITYQKVFTGLSLTALAEGGSLAVIAPSSWLGDKESEKLRKLILSEYTLRDVELYREDAKLFDTVNQPTAIAAIDRMTKDSSFKMIHIGRDGMPEDEYQIQRGLVEDFDPEHLRIPKLRSSEYALFLKLQRMPKVRDCGNLVNSRGELDQTQGKECITNRASPLRFVRGNDIERFWVSGEATEFINESLFIDKYGKGGKFLDHKSPRIIGRQVSYLNKPRRLSFAFLPPGYVIGNSCNYITCRGPHGRLSKEEFLFAVLAILNSSVPEWFFRVFNSNNHVANYEIDQLPLRLENTQLLRTLSVISRHLSWAAPAYGFPKSTPLEDVLDALVAFSFDLEESEVQLVLRSLDPERCTRVGGMLSFFQNHGVPEGLGDGEGWFDHVPSSLSQLDLETISHIPQGGNWQDVPPTVPGKRLEQIRAMSKVRGIVRTSYYGRLRPDQPSYTISTYYNRPGNGTNIHPWEDRTLTDREAARLQSFPDWYLFLGSKTSKRNQIGNAVPPLLSQAVAAHLGNQGLRGKVVDVFGGSGGLSFGFERDGWEVIAAVDCDRSANLTYQLNRPCEFTPSPSSDRTLSLESDLLQESDFADAIRAIKEKLDGQRLEAVIGGPPCQGFSHAGWRQKDDKRNDLASVFLDVVFELDPKVVVLENVEGLLTYERGAVLTGILTALVDLGFNIDGSPWKLNAEQYGVPQMRRRVFVVGVKRQRGIEGPPKPLFQKCLGRREVKKELSLRLQEPLPYPITVGEALLGLKPLGSHTHAGKGSRGLREHFWMWSTGLHSHGQFLNATRRS